MMGRRGSLMLLSGGLAAMLSGCGLFGVGSTYRYKMTVEVETPDGLKSGSAVREVSCVKQ